MLYIIFSFSFCLQTEEPDRTFGGRWRQSWYPLQLAGCHGSVLPQKTFRCRNGRTTSWWYDRCCFALFCFCIAFGMFCFVFRASIYFCYMHIEKSATLYRAVSFPDFYENPDFFFRKKKVSVCLCLSTLSVFGKIIVLSIILATALFIGVSRYFSRTHLHPL